MFRYEYEPVRCDCTGMGLFAGNIYELEHYRELIDQRAKDGWRYVGYMPTKQRGTGHIEELDLIFEKET